MQLQLGGPCNDMQEARVLRKERIGIKEKKKGKMAGEEGKGRDRRYTAVLNTYLQTQTTHMYIVQHLL